MTFGEIAWHPAAQPILTRTFFPTLVNAYMYEWAYAVYQDPRQPALLGGLGASPRRVEGTPFRDHLDRHKPDTFWDAVYVADAFCMPDPSGGVINFTGVHTLDFEFDPIPDVDEILEGSRGVLIWHHQLEQLYGLFSRDREACVSFRRGINKKMASAFGEAENLPIAPGMTLRDVIDQRLRFHVTKPANLSMGRLILGSRLP